MDYRYLDKRDITPRYEFGYGLSYVGFKLNSLIVNSRGISGPLSPTTRRDSTTTARQQTRITLSNSMAQGNAKTQELHLPLHLKRIRHQERPLPLPNRLRPLSENHLQLAAAKAETQTSTPQLSSSAPRSQISAKCPAPALCRRISSYPPNVKDADGELVDMPVKVLRAFEKYDVFQPKRISVQLELTRKDLSYWDVKRQTWVLPDGEFTAHLGFSSRGSAVE